MNKILKKATKKLTMDSVTIMRSNVITGDSFNKFNLSVVETKSQHYKGIERLDTLEMSSDSEPNLIQYGYIFHYSIGNRVLLKETDATDENAVSKGLVHEIKVVFGANFLSDEQLSKEEIAEFGKSSVGVSVWPYWCEYLQSTCLRLGAPIDSIVPYDFTNDDIDFEDDK